MFIVQINLVVTFSNHGVDKFYHSNSIYIGFVKSTIKLMFYIEFH